MNLELDQSAGRAAGAANAAAGRRLARVGLCYLVPGAWLCWPAWRLFYHVGGEALAAWRTPTMSGFILMIATVAALIVTVVAAGATGVLAGLVVAHRRLGRAIAAGSRQAATTGFVLVAMEMGCWLFVACAVMLPGVFGREGGFRLPQSPAGWLPLLMLVLSALLLHPLSRARRPQGPPPLPVRVLPV